VSTHVPRFKRLSLEEFLQLLTAYPFRRRINAVHMHHTWRPDHAQYRKDPEGAIIGMWRFHTQAPPEGRGFSDLAQHITIGPDGEVWTGRNWDMSPASAVGHNGNSVASPFMFEMIGNFDVGSDLFGGAQLDSTLQVIANVQRRFQLAPETLKFHNQMSSKTCPGTQISYAAIVGAVQALHDNVEAAGQQETIFGPEADRSRETNVVMTDLFFDRQVSRDLEEGELEENEMVPAQDRALGNALSAGAGALSVARGSLSTADLDKLRPHVVNLKFGELSSSGLYTNTKADVERIFRENIPELTRNWGNPLKLMFYAHGGLVSEASGLASALDQIDFWIGNRVYPIFFIWETGFLETVSDIIKGVFTGRRGFFDFTSDLWNKFLESAARPGGLAVWGRMKRSAEVSVLSGGGGQLVASEAAELVKRNGFEVYAAGHSAGCIFHSHFIPALLTRGLPQVKSLHFLAPAVNIPTFQAKLAANIGKEIQHLTMYTMKKDFERQDKAGPYLGSLLYLVHHSFEMPDENPILGLEENLRNDSKMTELFGLQGQPANDADVVFSVTSVLAAANKQSRATSHGDFDNDPYTMESVAKAILGQEQLLRPFPKNTRNFVAEELASLNSFGSAPPTTTFLPALHSTDNKPGVAASQPTNPIGARGRLRALCVGINAYRAPNALGGCVADAQNWGNALASLGFEVIQLIDGQANRDNILGALSNLTRSATAGDVLVFQYSGHGTHLKDLDGDETDGLDEALCPVDMMTGSFIIDDDLRQVLDGLPDQVSLTCFMDCCHSGTITRVVAGLSQANARGIDFGKARYIQATDEMQSAHESFRRARGVRSRPRLRGPESLKEIVFSACLPSEVAYESGGHGDFTNRAVPILGNTAFSNDEFLARVTASFGSPARQHPNIDCPPGWGSKPFLNISPPNGGSRQFFEMTSEQDVLQSLRTVANWIRS
jgi:hypothetical protein